MNANEPKNTALLRLVWEEQGNHRVAATSLMGWMGAPQCGQEGTGAFGGSSLMSCCCWVHR